MVLTANLGLAIVSSPEDPLARQAAYDNYRNQLEKHYGKLLAAESALRAVARSLLERIMDLEEQTPSDAR